MSTRGRRRGTTTAICVLLALALCPAAGADPGVPDGGADMAPGTAGVGANTVLHNDPKAVLAHEISGGKVGDWMWIWEVRKYIERKMTLEAPPMCFAPGTADAGRAGVVGLHGWAWICPDQIRDSTVGPKYLEVNNIIGLYGLNMSAHNPAVAVTWGDGSPPSLCVNPTPLLTEQPFLPYQGGDDALFQAGAGDLPSPSCGHFIAKSSVGEPNESFTVTATSTWIVYADIWIWGLFHNFHLPPIIVPWPKTTTYTQRIGEAQALNTAKLPG